MAIRSYRYSNMIEIESVAWVKEGLVETNCPFILEMLNQVIFMPQQTLFGWGKLPHTQSNLVDFFPISEKNPYFRHEKCLFSQTIKKVFQFLCPHVDCQMMTKYGSIFFCRFSGIICWISAIIVHIHFFMHLHMYICHVHWEMLKTEFEAYYFQHLPQDLANHT